MGNSLQQRLDRYHVLTVPSTETVITETLRIRAGETVCGFGYRSVICWAGDPNDPAVLIDDTTMHSTIVEGISVVGGFVHVARLGPGLRTANIIVHDAPAHGLYITGVGDATVFRGWSIRNAAGAGIAVVCGSRMNALTWDACEVSGCQGPAVSLFTVGSAATLSLPKFRDCTLQGNCQSTTQQHAEVEVHGAVTGLVIDGGHIERNRTTGDLVKAFSNDSGRVPRDLTIRDAILAPKWTTHAVDWRGGHGAAVLTNVQNSKPVMVPYVAPPA